jgi:hypothetical protein
MDVITVWLRPQGSQRIGPEYWTVHSQAPDPSAVQHQKTQTPPEQDERPRASSSLMRALAQKGAATKALGRQLLRANNNGEGAELLPARCRRTEPSIVNALEAKRLTNPCAHRRREGCHISRTGARRYLLPEASCVVQTQTGYRPRLTATGSAILPQAIRIRVRLARAC